MKREKVKEKEARKARKSMLTKTQEGLHRRYNSWTLLLKTNPKTSSTIYVNIELSSKLRDQCLQER